jgi:hypothetical protein
MANRGHFLRKKINAPTMSPAAPIPAAAIKYPEMPPPLFEFCSGVASGTVFCACSTDGVGFCGIVAGFSLAVSS